MADTRDKHDGSIREFASHSRFLTTASFLQKSLWLWKLNLGVENRSKKLEIRTVKSVKRHLYFQLRNVSIRPNCNIFVRFVMLLKHHKNGQVIYFQDGFPFFLYFLYKLFS